MDFQSPISELPSVGPAYSTRLKRLGIYTIGSLLYHIPSRYLDFESMSTIFHARAGETTSLRAKISSVKNIYTRQGKKMQIAEIADDSGKMNAVWFNQPFLTRTISEGSEYWLSGKVSFFNRRLALISPEYEIVNTQNSPIHTARLVPVYPETSGVSSKWLRTKVHQTLNLMKGKVDEFLPKDILEELRYPGLEESLRTIHFPENLDEVPKVRERLAFDEFLIHQLRSLIRKKDWANRKTAHKLAIDQLTMDSFATSLPFDLTTSQLQSIKEIREDLDKNTAMNRLLQGDVGAGKTVIAAAAAFVSFCNGFQTAIMAPTQILANQHFDTLKQILHPFKVRIELITGKESKSELGRTDIFVGTHALIHKKADFDKVGLVVIDEQHRFGVEQRKHLIKKSGSRHKVPHVLTMTATPIPRTIALTVYGDLDLSTLNELPKNRQSITTWLVPPQKRGNAYEWIDKKIAEEQIQAFVVCPLIEESEKDTMQQVRAATVEYKNLKEKFRDLRIGLLHGRQQSTEKHAVLDKFRNGEIDILVTTPVVEVGIDVPNATVMIIEAAERFGLAQLHQLRGRVGRGSKKSYCLLFTESPSLVVQKRINLLTQTYSGFDLAEMDLKIRGPGEVFGVKQHGFPELKIASWNDSELIKETRVVAEEAIASPTKFSKLLKLVATEEDNSD